MNRIPSHFFLLLCCYFWSLQNLYAQVPVTQIRQYINPFIGTGGHGHTFPGPTLPFGACQASPDTRLSGWDGCSGYHYSDSIIYGFSHTHLSGTGCSDYGDILLMPVTKEMSLNDYQYKSGFSHENETAKAGYYQVYLNDPMVNVELVSVLHGAMHKYTYQSDQELFVVLDLKHRDEVIDSKIEKVDDYTIQGYRYSKAWARNQKVFYRITFSNAIESIQYEQKQNGSMTTMIEPEKSLHCIIKFKNDAPHRKGDNIRYLATKVSLSGVDEAGAEYNMNAELPNWDFDKYVETAAMIWEKELGKIKILFPIVEDMNSDSLKNKLTIFYTALYHVMIHPSIYNDVDGRYRGRDDKIHNTDGKYNYYTVFSLWDTYRGLHPLLSIIDRKRTNDFINTFIMEYEHGGRLPVWELSSNETNCMIGYHVVSVIWDAYRKGIRNYDVAKAFKAMKSIATQISDYSLKNGLLSMNEDAKARCADADALESYCKFGYVRSDDAHESVSKTLEYAYNDWCIAQMAKALGKTSDYNYYNTRSHQWQNVFDPGTRFMRARKNGTLYQPFSPYTVDNNYTEANSWQYSFYVPHEMNELIQLHGGKQAFDKHLDDLFSAHEKTEGREQADITGLIGQYAHGNEPSHQLAYLYNIAGNPGKTQKITQRILDSFYMNKPDGLIGNEDCGQMSAWYVMTALGIYPVCPGNNEYEITEPAFNQVIINDSIILKKVNPAKGQTSISYSVKNKLVLPHDELLKRKTIEFAPKQVNVESGVVIRNNSKSVSVPFIVSSPRIFKDSNKIEFQSLFSEAIYYSINRGPFTRYSQPFWIKDKSDIKFYAKQETGTQLKSLIQLASFTKLPNDRKVMLKSTYNKSYSAGGADAMIDGINGKLNWRAGDWQGYQGQDVETIIELKKPTLIQYISANFLEDQNSWIFYPKAVSFYVSSDNEKWTLIETIKTGKSDHNENVSITKISTSGTKDQMIPTSKYIKVIAQNFGPMPQWHEGRGNETFIFIDEIEIN